MGRKIHVWQDLPGRSSDHGSDRRRRQGHPDLGPREGRRPRRRSAGGGAGVVDSWWMLVLARFLARTGPSSLENALFDWFHSLKINHEAVKSPPSIQPCGTPL